MILPARPVRPRPVLPRRSFRYRKRFSLVYQFKVSLEEIKPSVWRRIQVPDRYSFWDLHCAITDCLGWLDYHLHLFSVRNPLTGQQEQIGIPDDEGFPEEHETLPGWDRTISDYFTKNNLRAGYEYDFGDGWQHAVTLEEICPRQPGAGYPRCIAGERACPPEDCGGVDGYERFLKAIANPKHKEHQRLLTWVGGCFDPGWFELGLVRFEDPDLRWRIAFRDAPVPGTMRQVQYHHLKQ